MAVTIYPQYAAARDNVLREKGKDGQNIFELEDKPASAADVLNRPDPTEKLPVPSQQPPLPTVTEHVDPELHGTTLPPPLPRPQFINPFDDSNIGLLSSFCDIMRRNYEKLNVEKIQERRCCGDQPFLFCERWEKLFEDFCDVEQKKFDPSRVSELYDTIKYCALHHRSAPFSTPFSTSGRNDPLHPGQDRRMHERYSRAKALFDLVAPQEYGIDLEEKEEIGILTSLPILRNVFHDLEEARKNNDSLTVYFTKESHIHTLVNLVLLSGLPIANRRIPELDYASHITFELYERNHGRGKTDKEYSIRLSINEGAHSSNVLDSTLDARHSLNVQPKRKLTQHLPYSLVMEKLSKHFHRTTDLDDDVGETIDAVPPSISDGIIDQ